MTSARAQLLSQGLILSLWAFLFSSVPLAAIAEFQPSPLSQPARTGGTSLTDTKRLIESGHFKEAEDWLRASLLKDDHSAEARYLLGYVLLRQNHPKEALEQYTLAATLRAPTASELNDVAKAYVLLEDYSDAGKWLNRSLEMNPNDPETLYSLGRLRFTEQQFGEALEYFKRTLELAPGSVKAENNLGLAYYGLNRTDEAEAAYRQAILWQDSGPPQDASEQPLLNLGIVLVERGQLAEAKALLMRAGSIAPREPRIHEQLGQIAMQLGNFSDAREEFEKATQLDPEKANFHYLLGQAYRHLGRQQDAKREFDAATRLTAHH